MWALLLLAYVPPPGPVAYFNRRDSLGVLSHLQPNPRFYPMDVASWATSMNTYTFARSLLEKGGSNTMSVVDHHDNLFVVYKDDSHISVECVVWYHPFTNHTAYAQNMYRWCTRVSGLPVSGDHIGNQHDRALWQHAIDTLPHDHALVSGV